MHIPAFFSVLFTTAPMRLVCLMAVVSVVLKIMHSSDRRWARSALATGDMAGMMYTIASILHVQMPRATTAAVEVHIAT